MSRILGGAAQVVAKYEGFIDKFMGDAVMALFGVPKSHEDDPVRAIRAATEIHDLVEEVSGQFEDRIGRSLSMHTGINTGLVITDEMDLEKGTEAVLGDTVNTASRLTSLAEDGEIIVGPDTYRRTEREFDFEDLEPAKVKGKAEAIQVYKVLSAKESPSSLRRTSGLRADLIGREAELARFSEAVGWLRDGKGSIFSISGDAGTGKSRLVEEFKATLDPKEIQWREGHSYAYSRNIPYFPLIDLLSREWGVQEGDSPKEVKEKVESNLSRLIGENDEVAPYIGSLFGISYPEIEEVSPEFWRSRLFEGVQIILRGLTQLSPTIIFLEDVHWTDPSSLDLLRSILSGFDYPAMILFAYRPEFSLFTDQERSEVGDSYQEMVLHNFSSKETEDILKSLLKTKDVPMELKGFVREKVEGNPFYLEEVVHSLIESETLVRDNGSWRLTKSIGELDIPSTVQGIISARLDHLEKEMKRILQEASVIGRNFLYDILKRVTEIKAPVDQYLMGLEKVDLIRTRSLQPDLEYIFKHALTQEVVYNGLLRRERQVLHERVALLMEELFHDRLSEFYETLAFHFKGGQSLHKAVEYLMRSGEKSMSRYAVEESHQFFKEAYDLLANKVDKTREEKEILVDLLIEWAEVFYYRGDFRGLNELFRAHEDMAESLDDKARLGMFYAWLGFAISQKAKFKDSYQYLQKALVLGEEIGNQKVIGYACAWLTFNCVVMGLLDEAISFGKRAQNISELFESDHYLFFKSLSGMGTAFYYRGERKKALEAGKTLFDYSRKHSNIRSMVVGHTNIGYAHIVNGDFPSAIDSYQRAIQVSEDPFYTQVSRINLGSCFVLNDQLKEAEDILQKAIIFCRNFGAELFEIISYGLLGCVSIIKGDLSRGMKMLEEGRQAFLENEGKTIYAHFEYTMGYVYLQMVEGSGQISLSTIVKNIGFIVKNVPFAGKKAEKHFKKAIEVSEEIGAKYVLGQAYLGLGSLYKAKKRKDQAREYISKAIGIFEETEAEGYLKQAKEALQSLE